jgi:transposase, IS5 family
VRRLRDDQQSLWEAVIPKEWALQGEWAALDVVLDDDEFLEPFARRLESRIGRPTIPMERYLRMMVVKHRYGWGYETLVREVADSISLRHFCRVPLGAPVPHSTTLIKLTRRFGPEVLGELNHRLVETAVERKLIRGRRLRIDTTVTEADVAYPTDSGLCADAVGRIGKLVDRVKRSGLAVRTLYRDRARSTRKLDHNANLSAKNRAQTRREVADKKTAEIHRLATDAVREAERVLRNAQRAVGAGKHAPTRLLDCLGKELENARRVLDQTGQRLRGVKSIPGRLVSLSDTDARPIRRGKLRRPTEFGYKVAVGESPEGFIVGHGTYIGNPPDTDTIEDVVGGAQRAGMRVTTAHADRGFGDAAGDEAFERCGITDRVIPRKGKPDPCEHTARWKHRHRFRAGIEGRISGLKRRFGLGRTRLKGIDGARIWVGYGVFAHNLHQFVTLA